jgi:hypothetical protein
VYAGPGGDRITATPPAFCSGGDVCQSFCTLEIQACGSGDQPRPDTPPGVGLFQYDNLAECMKLCPRFDLTHPYTTSAKGNSLACRLHEATLAAVSIDDAVAHCAATGMLATDACAGAAMP